MSIQEPAWLKRTRPCPFFSQGRCLFADSCNFLHDIKVKNAVDQPLLGANLQVEQSPLPSKPVFDLPSVIVNSASPRSAILASPDSSVGSVQDSSRYSGLLSVLSDVIGPPPCFSMEPEQGTSSRTELPECDLEDTVVDAYQCEVETFIPVDSELAAESPPVPDHVELADGNATSYFVGRTETHVMESEEDDGNDGEDTDDCREEDSMTMKSNRQSTFSSFTGASLLASPRNSVFGDDAGTMDLLSPVQLSAKLQPFPIPLLGFNVKRGDSIDSGYADGDSWVSPLPFPRSPPRDFQSPVTFLSHSRRVSHSSPAFRDRRSSCNASALHPSSRFSIEVIKEDRSERSEDGGDTTSIILGTDDTSKEQGDDETCDPLQMNVAVVAEEAEEDESPEVAAVTHSLRPTREYDPDSYSRLSLVSDDNVSFKTALSTQPSFGSLSDLSKASPVKPDSLLPSISGRATPNTSLLSHYDDASDPLGQPVVSSYIHESISPVSTTCMASQIGARISGARTLKEIPIDSNVLFASGTADGSWGLAMEMAVASRVPLSSVCHSNRRSLIPSPSVDSSHNQPSARDVYDLLGAGDFQDFAPEKNVSPQECLFGAFRLDERPPRLSSSAEISYSSPSFKDAFDTIPLGADDLQEVAPGNAVALQERFLGILYSRRSPNSSPSIGSSYSPSPRKDVLGDTVSGSGVVHGFAQKDVISLGKRFSGVSHLDRRSSKQSSSTERSLNPSSIEDSSSSRENVALQERLSGVHSGKPLNSSTKGSNHPSLVKGDLKYTLLGASPESSPAVLRDSLTECGIVKAVQNMVAEKNRGFDEITESFGYSIQRLSFPLPPPFLPDEFVGLSTSSDDTSIPPEVTVMKFDVLNTGTALRHKEVQRTLSGSDLTEKAGPIRLPPVGSHDPNVDITFRRGRAASDLTVKGGSSSVITPGDTHCASGLSPSPLEQQGRPDIVHSLYDQYFDASISDGGSESLSPMRRNMTPPDSSSLTKEAPQDFHLQSVNHTPQVSHRVSSPYSDSTTSDSGADHPRSESVLRPILTGKKSFLRSSLAELIPRANLVNFKESSTPPHPSNRLQVREIGSTKVPLGFRRRKPRLAVMQSLPNTILPVSKLREMLRIRTDIAEEDLPRGCSSAVHVSSTTRSPLEPMSAPPTTGLKALHLSSTIDKRTSTLSTYSSSIASSILSINHISNSSTPQSPSVSSATSFSRSSLFSSPCERIPDQMHHIPERPRCNSLIPHNADDAYSASQSSMRRDSRSASAPIRQSKSWRLSHYRASSRNYSPTDDTHRSSRRSSIFNLPHAVDEEQEIDGHDPIISCPIQSNDWTGSSSVLAAPLHAIATPKPTLLFAIASDNVDQVRQVLESGEAGPNDTVGPQSALAFTLTNDKLAHKQEIIKALLAYGASPSALRNPTLNPASCKEGGAEPSTPPPETTLEGMDPATRYFVARADAAHTRQTSQLIYRSCFRPLTRVRYDVIGQDWALEQLFRVLGTHSQKLAVAPIVVLMCGPSGHGKSLLARKFGSLLNVPTHTVNMTTLRSAHDIWQSHSMSPYEELSSCTLAEFLIENEGKRCVVVLDEIEKVEDQKALWSLLMPWELGRCSLEAGKRHVDARHVVWLGTSNVGHELVFEHHENRAEPDRRMSREEYLELTGMLRPRVSNCLGASLVSRVTAVLPFIPFTLDERKAIAAEAVYALLGVSCKMLSPQDVESLVVRALASYHPDEGARSLHRAVSNILVDAVP